MQKLVMSGLALSAVCLAACGTDTSSPSSQLAITMASAYSTTPTGFGELSSSYDASGSGGAFQPGFAAGFGHGGRGGPGGFGFGGPGPGPGFGLGLMGGGMIGGFLGDGLDHGFFHVDAGCAFAGGTGLVTCGPTTRNGITTTRITSYQTAAGTAQSARDSLTNTITTSVTVAGTSTRRDSSTSTVNETSRQTVTGLAAGSSSRTVNGTSAGTEQSTGTSKQGAFTASRIVGDTVTGLVMPRPASMSAPAYPTAGTVIRSMSATVTISGQSPATSLRREVVTYDGSATAKVMITVDGSTQNCTLPLPHGRLACQ